MKTAINGTGVAGPTLAYWLQHHGHDPVLFEKAEALRTGGYVIDFWGLGYEVAERMAILPALREKAYFMEELRLVADDGSIDASMKVDAMRSAIAGRFISLPRGDLAATVFRACKGVEAKFGLSIEEIEQRDEDVVVTLSDGSRESFDLVVGGDGAPTPALPRQRSGSGGESRGAARGAVDRIGSGRDGCRGRWPLRGDGGDREIRLGLRGPELRGFWARGSERVHAFARGRDGVWHHARRSRGGHGWVQLRGRSVRRLDRRR